MPSSRDDRKGPETISCGAVRKPTDNRRTPPHTWSICAFCYPNSALVGMVRRLKARSHFDSVRVGIGTALRSLYLNVLNEPLPDRIAELLRQLDEQLMQLDQNADKE
jgi:hypothetical protein